MDTVDLSTAIVEDDLCVCVSDKSGVTTLVHSRLRERPSLSNTRSLVLIVLMPLIGINTILGIRY